MRSNVWKMSLTSRWLSMISRLSTAALWKRTVCCHRDMQPTCDWPSLSSIQSSPTAILDPMSYSLLSHSLQLHIQANIVVNCGLSQLGRVNLEYSPQWHWLLSFNKMPPRCTLSLIIGTWCREIRRTLATTGVIYKLRTKSNIIALWRVFKSIGMAAMATTRTTMIMNWS
jgi:hypothetical protein